MDSTDDAEGARREVADRMRRYKLEPVGPSDETRAEMRTVLLKRLDKLRIEVENACGNCLISDNKAAQLQLRIHREQAALLGLSVAQYSVPW